MMFKNIKRNQKGFTLVELMVVVAIIGILAAIAIPKFSGATDTAKVGKIQADLRTIGSAVAAYYANNNAYPANIGALVTANLLAEEPKMPGGDSYSYDSNTGVASATFGGKTYYSDGKAPTPASGGSGGQT